jgi:ATP-dependent helicase/nuclease subunit B
MNGIASQLDTLVVPTARIAAALRREHARAERARGQRVWQAPDCVGLGAWLVRASLPSRSSGRLAPAFALLGDAQSEALWAEIIGAGGELAGRQVEALARLMGEAETLVFDWELRGAWSASVGLTSEQVLARSWREAFRRRCAELGVGTRTMLFEACARAGLDLRAGARSRGFEAAGPGLRGLLPPAETVVDAGPAAVSPAYRLWASVEDELDAALDWALAARRDASAGGVALVCPDARGAERLVQRAARWLAVAPDAGQRGAPAVLASAVRGVTAPLVTHALLMLGATLAADGRRPLAIDDAVELLASPFLRGAQAEFGARALLAARIRQTHFEPLPLARFAALAREGRCPRFADQLEAALRQYADTRRSQGLAAWVPAFQQWLAVFGWPGEQPLDLQEEAAREAWNAALDGLAALELVLPGGQSGPAALGRLRQLARGIGTASVLAPDAIDVLTVEEAAVLRPARAWVLGLHDGAWPPTALTNPLLPHAVLRQGGAPGSDFARDAARARAALEVVRDHARELVLSHAEWDGDTPLRPGGGIPWPLRQAARAPALGLHWTAPSASVALEPVPTEASLPLAAARQRGGVGVLAAQAACPFQAFARYRLEAQALEEAAPGLDPRVRGELVHAVMAALWTRLRSRDAAAALDPHELDEAIAEAVEAALDPAAAGGFPDGVRTLERRRLQRLALQSVQQDLRRGRAFEVIGIEAQHALTLAGLPLAMRIDRIDRLDDGALVVIDYKTGAVARKEWTLPRPLAPQLPAYALALEHEPLAAIAFAQLKAGDCKLLTEPATRLIGTEEGRDRITQLRCEWREELTRLAQAFAEGRADVDPRDGPATCRRCDFAPLCRVHELDLRERDEEEPDEP